MWCESGSGTARFDKCPLRTRAKTRAITISRTTDRSGRRTTADRPTTRRRWRRPLSLRRRTGTCASAEAGFSGDGVREAAAISSRRPGTAVQPSSGSCGRPRFLNWRTKFVPHDPPLPRPSTVPPTSLRPHCTLGGTERSLGVCFRHARAAGHQADSGAAADLGRRWRRIPTNPGCGRKRQDHGGRDAAASTLRGPDRATSPAWP